MKRFTFTLDTEQQMEFLGIILATSQDIILGGNTEHVRDDLPLGWQDIFASDEKVEAITGLTDCMLDRMAEHKNGEK